MDDAENEKEFASAPQTVSEIRALAKNDASWTVRDMLVHLLRQIDNDAVKFTNAVVILTRDEKDGVYTDHWMAGPTNMTHKIGMVTRVQQRMCTIAYVGY